MITPLIDRFCDSQNRWLIVTAVTFVAGLLTVLPQVDHYFAQLNEQQGIEEELVHASRAAKQLPSLEKREAAETASLLELEEQTINADRFPDFRNSLVELVRDTGCQLRRINVTQVQTRAWLENDKPIGENENPGKPTSFVLETRPVTLSVSGPTASVRELLARVQKEQRLHHAESMDLRPTGRNRRGVQMDLELWYFALERKS